MLSLEEKLFVAFISSVGLGFILCLYTAKELLLA